MLPVGPARNNWASKSKLAAPEGELNHSINGC